MLPRRALSSCLVRLPSSTTQSGNVGRALTVNVPLLYAQRGALHATPPSPYPWPTYKPTGLAGDLLVLQVLLRCTQLAALVFPCFGNSSALPIPLRGF